MSDLKIVNLYVTKENIAALLTGKKLYSMINGDEYAITIEMKDENKTHNTDTSEANE